MKVVWIIAVFIGGLIVGYLMLALGVVDRVDGLPGNQTEPEISLPTYLSFVSVMMTTVTAVLAAVAIGIGVVAFYTFPGLKAEARTVAETTAKTVAESSAKGVAKDVADEALAEIKIKAMVFDLYAKAEKERQQVDEWGEDAESNEDR